MTIEARMAAFLTHASITALVSSRTYAVNSGPSPTMPYIVWQRVSSERQQSHDAIAGLEAASVQVTCIATTHASATAIRAAVVAVIEGNHSGGPATCENMTDIEVSDELTAYATAADFRIWNSDV